MMSRLLPALQSLHAFLVPRLLCLFLRRRHAVTREPTLIIAPHQDDETLGCGGLLALKREAGTPVHVVFLTDGKQGTLQEGAEGTAGLVATRRQEALAALARLGVPESNVTFLDYPDGGLAHLDGTSQGALVERLSTLLKGTQAREVYVPHRADGHPDHEAAFGLTRAAVARSKVESTLYQYPIWLWWTQPALWRLLREVGSLRQLPLREKTTCKRQALQCHQSQLPRFPHGFLSSVLWPTEIYFPVGARSSPSRLNPGGRSADTAA